MFTMEELPHSIILHPRKNRDILDKVDRVAVHASDFDGIASAALLVLMKPSIKIDFLTVSEALNPHGIYDMVIDLPKIGDAINIDHHKTNYERLISEGRLYKHDLVDPDAPSAAVLVAKYFDIMDDPHVAKIVEMANRADLGDFDDRIYVIDKVIKCNSRNKENLYRIMWAIARYGEYFEKDSWLQMEIERIRGVFDLCKRVSDGIAEYVLNTCRVHYLVVQVISGIPRICVGDIMHKFMERGGKVIVLINTMTGPDKYCPTLVGNTSNKFFRVSIRSRDESFDARRTLELFGGGGHKVAAGARIQRDLLGEFITMMLQKLSSLCGEVLYIKITEKTMKLWGG